MLNRRFVIDLNTMWKYLCKEKPSDSSMLFDWVDKIITRSSSWELKLIEMRGTRLFYLPNSVKMCDIFNKDVLGGDQPCFLLQAEACGSGLQKFIIFVAQDSGSCYTFPDFS